MKSALRNGTPFREWDLPQSIQLVRDRILKQPKGDRAFVELLLMARDVGLETLEVACDLVLDGNVVTASVVMNAMQRLIAPRAERDRSLEFDLMDADALPNISGLLAACWGNKSIFVEATHLLPDLGPDKIKSWLPAIFEKTWRAGLPAVPLVRLQDLTEETREAYKVAAYRGSNAWLAIAVSADDLSDHEALSAMIRHFDAMGLSTASCSIVADFAGSDFSQPKIVAPVIGGALQTLQELGQWRQIIFQGTNYPEFNPAAAGSQHIVSRNEWIAWQQAVKFDPQTADQMIFGDYGADCAKMEFGESGGRAIRHYRYTTPEAWIVQRGAATGADEANMRTVCREIVEGSNFAGRSFSSADDYIHLTAHGRAGPGNAAIWRAINTTHHITQLVADIGTVKGFNLQRRVTAPLEFQESLFAAS